MRMFIYANVNERSQRIWDIISQRVEFKNKVVVDLGCGNADLLWRIWEAGAIHVVGVDNDVVLLDHTLSRYQECGYCTNNGAIKFVRGDLNSWMSSGFSHSVTLALSVESCVSDYHRFLKALRKHCKVAIIEYSLDYVPTDRGILADLKRAGFPNCELIGTVDDRDIWLCK